MELKQTLKQLAEQPEVVNELDSGTGTSIMSGNIPEDKRPVASVFKAEALDIAKPIFKFSASAFSKISKMLGQKTLKPNKPVKDAIGGRATTKRVKLAK
jgi:hypothetical protein